MACRIPWRRVALVAALGCPLCTLAEKLPRLSSVVSQMLREDPVLAASFGRTRRSESLRRSGFFEQLLHTLAELTDEDIIGRVDRNF